MSAPTRSRLGSVALAILIALALVHGALSARARACECSSPNQGFLLPIDGATSLPTALSLWTLGEASIDRLFVDGLEVRASAVFQFEIGLLRQWGPLALSAESDHQVTFEEGAICDFGGPCEARTIRTGAMAIEARPAVPTLVSERWSEHRDSLFGGSSSCGERAFFTMEVAADPGTLVLLQVDGPKVDDATTLAEVAANGGSIRAVRAVPASGRVSLVLGRAACESTWDFDAHDEAPFRLGAIDVLGQFSGWSPREVAETSGCVVAGPMAGLGWLASLVLVVAQSGAFRRRRRAS